MAEYEDALCVQCGQLRSVCESREQDWYPQQQMCYASAARSVVTRRFQERYGKAKPDAAGFLPTDGALVWVAPDDLSPGDDFLG